MKRGLKRSNQTRKFGNRSSTGPQGSVTKAIVFDLGGVLVDLHSVDARRELIDDYGMPAERFDRLTRSCFTQPRRSITELAMIGRASTSEYLSSFSRECRRKDIDGMRNNRLSVLGRERRAVFDIVNQLKESGTTCCILSNTIALHWEKLESRSEYPSLREFDHIFASHLIQRAKPRRNAFFFVAEALKIHMSECLLIDDTALNVDGARRAGWSGLLFTDAATLRRDLARTLGRHDAPSAPVTANGSILRRPRLGAPSFLFPKIGRRGDIKLLLSPRRPPAKTPTINYPKTNELK